MACWKRNESLLLEASCCFKKPGERHDSAPPVGHHEIGDVKVPKRLNPFVSGCRENAIV